MAVHLNQHEIVVLTLYSFQLIIHRVHRVATAAFWRTFSDEGKISPGWWGWGVHAHPLSLHLPSPVKLQCTLQLSGQIHWPCFISINICTLCNNLCDAVSIPPPHFSMRVISAFTARCTGTRHLILPSPHLIVTLSTPTMYSFTLVTRKPRNYELILLKESLYGERYPSTNPCLNLCLYLCSIKPRQDEQHWINS